MTHPQWHIAADDRITLSGALDRLTVPDLWSYIQQWAPQSGGMELSLERVDRIDSAGMVLLIHLIEHAKKQNCHIMLSFVPQQLTMLFKLSNAESLLADHIK
ncbi:phospholipid transport system transporter-binding protein [Vibrio xiamenensis]|uniref:Phospholipid transport system transporter-binding protein n=1 Tax=Vibrio xiamenensis TaxID=861298 RepID=A0A1G8BD27_9VIBR|nr:lipid asymmetry maintenance protein MlaB [Vibrio xiamenensis]SDH30933.1 phospholipid transport system transporter-binding protein [Vibrio xiamenensis]